MQSLCMYLAYYSIYVIFVSQSTKICWYFDTILNVIIVKFYEFFICAMNKTDKGLEFRFQSTGLHIND